MPGHQKQEKVGCNPQGEATPTFLPPLAGAAKSCGQNRDTGTQTFPQNYGATAVSHSGKTSVAILGVPIDNLSMDEVIQIIEERILEGGFHQIATANADFLIRSIHDEELYEALCRCDMVLADGMSPLVGVADHGYTLKERVTGADLVPRLVRLSAHRGYRIFCWGHE